MPLRAMFLCLAVVIPLRYFRLRIAAIYVGLNLRLTVDLVDGGCGERLDP